MDYRFVLQLIMGIGAWEVKLSLVPYNFSFGSTDEISGTLELDVISTLDSAINYCSELIPECHGQVVSK